jgi:hypothetical protein
MPFNYLIKFALVNDLNRDYNSKKTTPRKHTRTDQKQIKFNGKGHPGVSLGYFHIYQQHPGNLTEILSAGIRTV